MTGIDKEKKRKETGKPVIILVAPQMGENIGAAARVMLNFGLEELRLVSPRDRWPNEKSYKMAAGAEKVLQQVRITDSLEQALEGIHYSIAASARPRGLIKKRLTSTQAVETLIGDKVSNSFRKSAVVFGPENAGLTNKEIALCDIVMGYCVNPNFKSLNLAQAVAVFCYEWSLKRLSSEGRGYSTTLPRSEPSLETMPASREKFIGMVEHLESELIQAGYFYPEEKKNLMIQNIRTALLRGQFTEQEVRTFRGIIKALARGRGVKHL